MTELLSSLILAVIFGYTTKIIINNKGYEDNWFWWGFFFGIFAIIVACTKPRNVTDIDNCTANFQDVKFKNASYDLYDELTKLAQLKEKGILTEEEYASLKANCLSKM